MALDESSSYLTTFNTPFGRYRWRRLPFSVSSAPEVFQRKMHELVEGMTGIEIEADDFIIVGCGTTTEEATADHHKVLEKFLKPCKERGVKLNTDKLNLRKTEVPFIGHVATNQGLGADPAKVRAIIEMPAPTDKAGVQRLPAGTPTVPKQIPATSVQYHQAIKRTKSDECAMGLGNSPTRYIRSFEESSCCHASIALLQFSRRSDTSV